MVNRDLDFQVGCVVRSVEMELKELRILLSLYIYLSAPRRRTILKSCVVMIMSPLHS